MSIEDHPLYAAINAALKATNEAGHHYITHISMTAALEAAAPHMLAGAKAEALEEMAADVSLRIDQIEAHHVPESEYGTLLAQREESVSIYRDIRARAASYRPTP